MSETEIRIRIAEGEGRMPELSYLPSTGINALVNYVRRGIDDTASTATANRAELWMSCNQNSERQFVAIVAKGEKNIHEKTGGSITAFALRKA